MSGQRIVIDGGETVLLLAVGEDGRLHQIGLGGAEAVHGELAFPIDLYPLAYPTFGEELLREPALRVTHATGSPSTRLVYERHHQQAHPHGIEHSIELRDRTAPLRVVLRWRTWPTYGVIEQWAEVTNTGVSAALVHQVSSAAPALPGEDPWFTHWGGGWAHEWVETTEPIRPGTKTVASAGGVRPSLHRPAIALFAGSGRAAESEGSVLAATVLWGGDTRFDAEMGPHRFCRLIAGMQHRGAERTLDPGEKFVAPPVALVWSDHGVGPTSRSLHRWAREQVIRDGDRHRDIVFNNWETMFFDLDTDSVSQVVDGAAEIGADLFLLDDGWFGGQYPRDNDLQGLGDWGVDAAKFPDGLRPIIDHTLAAGLRFGLWVEPEMVNPKSELYEQHPDWVIHEPGRERREERQQLVLDVLKPEVAQFVLSVIDDALAMHPGISYLKWDANRDVFESGSETLPAERQSHVAADRVRATEEIMAEVARRHPDVELMACASGGGRSDLATLRCFHELWTSDNTDPVDRVRIQWGASHLLPASVLGAHVTRWGARPVAFACAVAMSGRLGFDLDPRTLSPQERSAATQAVEAYRRIRPLVQAGDLHRLVSPLEGPCGAVAYVRPQGDDASPTDDVGVLFLYRLENGGVAPSGPVVLPGIEASDRYLVEDLTPGSATFATSTVVDGATLLAEGLAFPTGPAPAAQVWLVRQES